MNAASRPESILTMPATVSTCAAGRGKANVKRQSAKAVVSLVIVERRESLGERKDS